MFHFKNRVETMHEINSNNQDKLKQNHSLYCEIHQFPFSCYSPQITFTWSRQKLSLQFSLFSYKPWSVRQIHLFSESFVFLQETEMKCTLVLNSKKTKYAVECPWSYLKTKEQTNKNTTQETCIFFVILYCKTLKTSMNIHFFTQCKPPLLQHTSSSLFYIDQIYFY